MTDNQRAKPAQQLARARERIVSEMDRLQQQIANMDEQVAKATLAASVARAEEAGLRAALDAIGPAATRKRRANGTAAPKRGRQVPEHDMLNLPQT